MPAKEELYVLAPGEGEDESEGWVSPRPIEEALVERLTTETDLTGDDLDDVETYVDLADVEAVLEGDDDDEISFTVEDHEVAIDASGQVRIDA